MNQIVEKSKLKIIDDFSNAVINNNELLAISLFENILKNNLVDKLGENGMAPLHALACNNHKWSHNLFNKLIKTKINFNKTISWIELKKSIYKNIQNETTSLLNKTLVYINESPAFLLAVMSDNYYAADNILKKIKLSNNFKTELWNLVFLLGTDSNKNNYNKINYLLKNNIDMGSGFIRISNMEYPIWALARSDTYEQIEKYSNGLSVDLKSKDGLTGIYYKIITLNGLTKNISNISNIEMLAFEKIDAINYFLDKNVNLEKIYSSLIISLAQTVQNFKDYNINPSINKKIKKILNRLYDKKMPWSLKEINNYIDLENTARGMDLPLSFWLKHNDGKDWCLLINKASNYANELMGQLIALEEKTKLSNNMLDESGQKNNSPKKRI